MTPSTSRPRVRVCRTVALPDPVKTALLHKSPGLGPKLLFFSGGTALRPLSEVLVEYTHNSIHLITPFDSGGSSAELRRAFAMPAVGDIRNRVMALADRSLHGNREVYALFATRLDKHLPDAALRERLERLVSGEDPLIRRVPDPMRQIIRSHLRFFADRMPADFDLRGASLGNLILAGGYFNYNRRIDPVIYLFSKLVEARGVVRPIVNADFHLAADLEDGQTVLGQHRLTGKEAPPIAAKVAKLRLVEDLATGRPANVALTPDIARLITGADLLCFPMGSFYSSLIANLLPAGVADAVAASLCPKVYVPGTGTDPEQLGMNVADAAATLFAYLEAGLTTPRPRADLLRFVLLDLENGSYPGGVDVEGLRRLGLEVIDARLVTAESRPCLDGRLLAEHLVSLA